MITDKNKEAARGRAGVYIEVHEDPDPRG